MQHRCLQTIHSFPDILQFMWKFTPEYHRQNRLRALNTEHLRFKLGTFGALSLECQAWSCNFNPNLRVSDFLDVWFIFTHFRSLCTVVFSPCERYLAFVELAWNCSPCYYILILKQFFYGNIFSLNQWKFLCIYLICQKYAEY